MEKKYLTFEEFETIGCDVDEAETTITWMRRDDVVKLYTCDNTVMSKLKWKVKNNPKEYKAWEAGRNKGKVTGYFFEFPLKYLSFRGGSDPKALQSVRERLSSADGIDEEN
jgi:hypothetical protein